MLKKTLFIFNLIFLLLLSGCLEEEKKAPAPATVRTPTLDFSLLTPSCFSAYSGNPILQTNDLFTNAMWNDPSVLYENGQYIMYASASVGFDGNVKIYRLVSTNSINWSLSPSTAVLEKGTGGAWDDKSVETPNVVKFNGTYYMFYTGYQTNTATDFKIGYATSPDGITWTKSGSNPILDSVGGAAVPDDFDQFVVAEPGAIVFNNQIYLYFTAQGYITTSGGVTINDQLMTIGLITSSDGTTWSAPQRVYDPDQTLYARSSNWKGHSTPNPIVMNGQVHLFTDVMYTDGGTDTQRKLHHAYSSDGTSNWTNNSASLFDRSDFAWTAGEIRSPTVYFDGDYLKMWFAGHQSFTLGIGYASCYLKN